MNVLYADQSLQAAKLDLARVLKKTLPELRAKFTCLEKAGHEYLFHINSTFIMWGFFFKDYFLTMLKEASLSSAASHSSVCRF